MAILEIHEDGDLDGVFTFDIMKLIHIAKARLTIIKVIEMCSRNKKVTIIGCW